MRWATCLIVVILVGCGSSPTSPSPTPRPIPAPTPSPAPAPAPAPPPTFTGTVTDTVTGAPVSGYTALLSGSRVTVSALGYLTREARNGPSVDLIREAAPFDLAFYRQFVRNTFDAPAGLEPLRRQQDGLRVYVRTIDESGGAVDSTTLSTVTRAITPALIEAFSGRRLTLLALERGTETREGQAGWITIKWPTTARPDRICGRAQVSGTWVELWRTASGCGCPGTGETYPRLVKHEIGHAMGFWHTSDRNDVMFNASTNDCDNNPSAREQYHAAIAYKRPVGNRDIDSDQLMAGLSAPRLILD